MRQPGQPTTELLLHEGLFFPPEDGLPHGKILAVLPSALPCTVNINFPQIKRKQVQVI